MRTPNFIPVLFHNLAGYDAHLFIKTMGLTEGDVKCIPQNDEKYISFSKNVVVDDEGHTVELRFLDSMKFVANMGLDKLVSLLDKDQFKNLERHLGTNDLLKKKGVYPYEYMDDFSKLSETQLPPKEAFYSKLYDCDISEEDYDHAKKVWNEMGCKNMRDYHDLYLKTDVLLLADVMEYVRDLCQEHYGLDPLLNYTAPGLGWDAAMKLSRVRLELITDPDMYLMVEEGIRGGMSVITKRYAKANNKYMKNYDPNKESSYIIDLDRNSLYPEAMSEALPVSGFKWMTEKQLERWETICTSDNRGCLLEVDLEYPEKLHDLHNDYPLAPERLIPEGSKVAKLIPNLYDKEKYVLHYKNLQQYLDLGMKLKKIHRGIEFIEKPWLKGYVDLNVKLRSESTNEFGKTFFKVMMNAVFGKTMENVRNRVNVKLITRESQLQRLANKPNYDRFVIFHKNVIAVHMKKTHVKLNKPIAVGAAILE